VIRSLAKGAGDDKKWENEHARHQENYKITQSGFVASNDRQSTGQAQVDSVGLSCSFQRIRLDAKGA